MRIYSMTATFGKLEHQTLTLQPGLTIIEASNEWGKSTWCAFLMAMLYGLDTRAKSTKTTLADKERYAPWSGSPMSGRIDLCWQGRDITIERHTRKRIPLGEFRAYETSTGLPVPELTAANCGELLLGVEASVYRRAGFIRFSDLPVTQDEALRSRLNALVTTGDESGNAERLSRELRDLKNRCRYNKTGLLPLAEEERSAIRETLRELESLSTQSENLRQRLNEREQEQQALENHLAALDHAAAQEDEARVAQARSHWTHHCRQLAALEKEAAQLPSRELAEQKLRDLRCFSEDWLQAQVEKDQLPPRPREPELPPPFTGPEPEATLQRDISKYEALRAWHSLGWYLAAGAGTLAAGALLAVKLPILAIAALVWTVLSLILAFSGKAKRRKAQRELEEKYAGPDTSLWGKPLERYRQEKAQYRNQLTQYNRQQGELQARLEQLQTRRASLCAEQSPARVMELWQEIMKRHDACDAARRDADRARAHLDTLSAMLRPVPPPVREDTLLWSREDTEKLLADNRADQIRLRGQLGQYQGRMQALGHRETLLKELDQVTDRIARLEDIYAALTIAQETLLQARQELQRRFAPRITRRARELMEAMTGGRYDRLTMDDNLSLHAGTREEDTQHSILWRSDGTVDQLYLALRLAVAQELTPEAPLILDDALVRFDDTRAKSALEILQSMAKTRQVLLFTCQGREKKLI